MHVAPRKDHHENRQEAEIALAVTRRIAGVWNRHRHGVRGCTHRFNTRKRVAASNRLRREGAALSKASQSEVLIRIKAICG